MVWLPGEWLGARGEIQDFLTSAAWLVTPSPMAAQVGQGATPPVRWGDTLGAALFDGLEAELGVRLSLRVPLPEVAEEQRVEDADPPATDAG